nr:hypothetical protein CQNTEFLM_CQNTEFLM_CDS_0004 [uncultured phage]
MNIQVSPRSNKFADASASSGLGQRWLGNSRFYTSTDSNENNARVAWLNLSTKPVRLSTSDDTVQAELLGNALFNITDLRNAIVYQHLLEN